MTRTASSARRSKGLSAGPGDFVGRWRLSRDGELTLRRRRGEDRAAVRATPLAAESGALVVSADLSQAGGRVLARTVRIAGKWSVDARNRLAFEVARSRGASDTLVFEGSWQLDASQRLAFRRRLPRGRRRGRGDDTLAFDGSWDFADDRTLVYRVEGGGTLRLRGGFQTRSILAKKGEIRWQLGAGASFGRRSRTLSLFGKWKLGRDLALEFELEGAKGAARTMRFGTAYGLGAAGEMTLALTRRTGEPLGAQLELTRDFLRRDGRAFFKFETDAREALVEAGVSLKW